MEHYTTVVMLFMGWLKGFSQVSFEYIRTYF